MFLENPVYNNEQFGWIEVICGSMFSGKTEELIRRIKRAKIANQKIKVFKPVIDSRSKNFIESHDESKLECIEVKSSNEILKKIDNCDVVAIDEAQFFDDLIVPVCNKIANNGVRVIIAGLDMDYLGIHLVQCQILWQFQSMLQKYMPFVKNQEILQIIVTEKTTKRISLL